MIRIHSFVFNPFGENTYILYDETQEAIIVDPGCYESHEQKELSTFVEKNSLKVVLLINTHCHIDHVLGNDFVKSKYKVPFLIHQQEDFFLRAVKSYASNYGFATYHEALPDKFLREGDKVTFGDSELDVLFLPGHSPGHIGLYSKADKFVLSGDVLFDGSVGRTDLPGGNMDTLLKSIQQKLFTLPNDTIVYSGHGPETTIGKEKVSNPFCAIDIR